MKKETIIYKKEVITDNCGKVVSQSSEKTLQVEEVLPEYVVMTSNYSNSGAMISGVPCKVLGKPYIKPWKKFIYGVGYRNVPTEVIDLKSCVTGYIYTVPNDKSWRKEFLSLAQANLKADIKGHHFPDPTDLIGKPFWPRDNSYITNLTRQETWTDLCYKHCVIATAPYDGEYKDIFGDTHKRKFIKVWYDHNLYEVHFDEWCLTPPGMEAIDIW